MNRISQGALVGAISKVRSMDLAQKEQLADEIFQNQPHMLGSCLVQKQLGVSLDKMDFLLEILFICYQAMKESGLRWPCITEDEQDRQLSRYAATVRFGEDVGTALHDSAMKQYIEAHPEKGLLAFNNAEIVNWLSRGIAEEKDKYVFLAAINFVNCMAFVSIPEAGNHGDPDGDDVDRLPS